MFNRVSILLPIVALVAVATAVPHALDARQAPCTPNPIYCCEQIVPPNSTKATTAAAAHGISLDDAQGLVGLACSPLSGVGVGSTGGVCTQEPACCFENKFGGIAVGCSRIGINL